MSNQKLMELQEQLAQMQKEIERLQQEKDAPRAPSKGLYDKYSEQIDAAREAMFDAYGQILRVEDVHSLTTYVSVGKSTKDGKIILLGSGTGMFDSLDSLNEEGLAAALDVFTNPRRIAILKVLVKSDMSASEIGQSTELKGGQLHHHLSILESAKLITKTGDKYKAERRVEGILCGLYAVIGGMEISRN